MQEVESREVPAFVDHAAIRTKSIIAVIVFALLAITLWHCPAQIQYAPHQIRPVATATLEQQQMLESRHYKVQHQVQSTQSQISIDLDPHNMEAMSNGSVWSNNAAPHQSNSANRPHLIDRFHQAQEQSKKAQGDTAAIANTVRVIVGKSDIEFRTATEPKLLQGRLSETSINTLGKDGGETPSSETARPLPRLYPSPSQHRSDWLRAHINADTATLNVSHHAQE